LQAILSEYGIIVENVALMDYRFNADYQMIITNKKIADTKTKTLISEKDSTVEMNKKLLQDALGEVNKAIAQRTESIRKQFSRGRLLPAADEPGGRHYSRRCSEAASIKKNA